MSTGPEHVSYLAGRTGYVIQVWGRNEPDGQITIIDSFTAGNSRLESTTQVPEGSDGAVSPEKLAEFAEKTARETAVGLGLPLESVEEDVDIDLAEHLGESDE